MMLSKFLNVDKEKQKFKLDAKILYGSAAFEHIQFVPPTLPTEVSNLKSFNAHHE